MMLVVFCVFAENWIGSAVQTNKSEIEKFPDGPLICIASSIFNVSEQPKESLTTNWTSKDPDSVKSFEGFCIWNKDESLKLHSQFTTD